MSYVTTSLQYRLQTRRFPQRSFIILSLALVVLQLVPHAIVFADINSTSYAPEILSISGIIIFLAVIVRPAHRFLFTGATVALAVALLLLLHGLLAAFFQPPNTDRQYASLAILVTMLTASFVMGPFLFSAPERAVLTAVNLFLGLYAAMGVASLLGIGRGTWPQPVYPFSEPSHYAIAACPILLAFCVTHKIVPRIGAIMAFYLIAYLVKSLTLAVCTTMVVLISVPIGGLAILGTGGALVAMVKLSLDYFTDRLQFAGTTQNLSTLAYKEGWELAIDALARSRGWGIGFQQLGQGVVNSESADAIRRLIGMDMNTADGSFIMSKLLAELGCIGLVLTVIFTIVVFRAALRLRRVALRKMEASAGAVLALSYVCGLAIEVFERSTNGYFSPAAMMFVAGISYFYAMRRRRPRGVVEPPRELDREAVESWA